VPHLHRSAGFPRRSVYCVLECHDLLAQDDFRIFRVIEWSDLFDYSGLKLQWRFEVIVDHRNPISDSHRLEGPPFGMLQVDDLDAVIDLRRFPSLKLYPGQAQEFLDRKSTRLNSSHVK